MFWREYSARKNEHKKLNLIKMISVLREITFVNCLVFKNIKNFPGNELKNRKNRENLYTESINLVLFKIFFAYSTIFE